MKSKDLRDLISDLPAQRDVRVRFVNRDPNVPAIDLTIYGIQVDGEDYQILVTTPMPPAVLMRPAREESVKP